MKHHILWIDSIKGFAMICVVIGHVVLGYLQAQTFPEAATSLTFFYNLIYSFHMPLFFMISGYLFSVSYLPIRENRDRYWRQVLNLLLLYIIYSLLLGGSKLFFSGSVTTPVTVTDLLLIPVKTIQLYWYLYVLLLYYLLFGAASTVNPRILLIISAVLSIVVSCSRLHIEWFEVTRFCGNMVHFVIGMELHTLLSIQAWKSTRFGLYVTAVIGLVVTLVNRKCPIDIPVVSVVVGAGIGLLLVELFQKTSQYWEKGETQQYQERVEGTNSEKGETQQYQGRAERTNPEKGETQQYQERVEGTNSEKGETQQYQTNTGARRKSAGVFSSIGRYSLEIYLLHTYFVTALRSVLPRVGVHNAALSVIISIIAGFGVPMIVGMVSRKIGVHRVLFRPGSIILSGKIHQSSVSPN